MFAYNVVQNVLTKWVTGRKRQQLITLHEHLNSYPVVGGVCVAHLYIFLGVSLLCSFMIWVPCCDFSYDIWFVFIYTHFVGGFMSYLHYLCLLEYSGVKHILCYVFFFVLYSPFCIPHFVSFLGLSITDFRT